MKLPFSFLKPKKEASEYYLALLLADEKVGAVILKADAGNLKKINAHETVFAGSLEDFSLDDLIAAVDKAISRAEEILPPHIQTHQTIFGVKDNWVDEETKKIKKEYLDKLKKVCNALDLTPLGFMVTTEAVTHLMQEEEGAPVSAVFAEIGKSYVKLDLLRGGKVIESVSSPHLESTPMTVDKLLGHFTVPVLPARIVIFQSKPDERTSQAFIAHHWSKSLPFLHMPQVTVLSTAFDTRSIMFGAATQMGFSVVEEDQKPLPKVAPDMYDPDAAETNDEENISESSTDVTEEPPIDFGETAEEAETDAAAASDFGFVIDQNIGDRPLPPDAKEEFSDEPLHHKVNEEAIDEEGEYESPRQRRSGDSDKLSFLASLSSLKLPKNLKNLTDRLQAVLKGGNSKLKIIVPVIAVIVVIIGIIWFYFYKMQANVILTLKPNMVSQDETVTFSTGQNNDFSNNLIAARSLSTSVNGQVSTSSTGKKDVGDKAKGTVTIYNNNTNSVSLSGGTTLTASNGQVFTLDNDVKIASESGDIFSGTKPGTADVSVTAKDIGTDGNEPSGTEFKIGGDNTVAAKNDNAFSGGTKKTVTVVSSNDIAKLRSDLPNKVQDAAKQKLASLASSGETVLPLVSSPVLENQAFTHHVDDQASQVSLTADVVYTGMAYSNSDLDDYAKSVMKQKYPQDPNTANKSVKETVNNVSQRTKQAATATISIQAGLLPDINKQDIISNIQNKSLGAAKDSLANLPQVAKADITFSPPIPLLPLLFPKLPKQISVTMTAQ
ncbi:MAG TPA: baseplate J/gp47 family protein [Candidatus Acidoferrales bacterium]|nr:baseplate J/gp47 family protein [Candidatus Acidoferrales bacterium]